MSHSTRFNSNYLHFYGQNKMSKNKTKQNKKQKQKQKQTMKYKGNLNKKLLFLQNDKNVLTTLLHSTDELYQNWQRYIGRNEIH